MFLSLSSFVPLQRIKYSAGVPRAFHIKGTSKKQNKRKNPQPCSQLQLEISETSLQRDKAADVCFEDVLDTQTTVRRHTTRLKIKPARLRCLFTELSLRKWICFFAVLQGRKMKRSLCSANYLTSCFLLSNQLQKKTGINSIMPHNNLLMTERRQTQRTDFTHEEG